MHLLITYDVATRTEGGERRLRRVARICRDYGQRVQFSVFECKVDAAQAVALKQRLTAEIDPDTDSLRFYNLGAEWNARVEHVGCKPAYDPGGNLIV